MENKKLTTKQILLIILIVLFIITGVFGIFCGGTYLLVLFTIENYDKDFMDYLFWIITIIAIIICSYISKVFIKYLTELIKKIKSQ